MHGGHFDLAAGERSSPKTLGAHLRADLLPPAAHSLERAHLVNSSIPTVSAGLRAGLFPKKVALGTAFQLTVPHTLAALSLCVFQTML